MLLLGGQVAAGLELVASVSQRGVRGSIRLQEEEGGGVTVTADLSVAPGAEGEYTWGVYEFPIDYTKVSRADIGGGNSRSGGRDRGWRRRAPCSEHNYSR